MSDVMPLLEVFGYVASVLIALSVMMSNIKHLRWLNLLGASAFSAYGYFIEAYPVFVLNGWVAAVNAYYLVRIYHEKDEFDLIRLTAVDTPLFTLLKQRYGSDIKSLQADFQWQVLDGAIVSLLFRNMKPVGIFAYRELEKPGKVEVVLDYVIPEYRDYKAAKFMFSGQNNQLNQNGINHLIVKNSNKGQSAYLTRVGFIKIEEQYEMQLTS